MTDTNIEDAAAPAGITPDPVLLASEPLARRALEEITPASTVGALAGHVVTDERTLSLLFENTLDGYPGWRWTVSLARVDDAEPTVLEVELLPGDGALLAPDWVPWSERLAEYRASQEAAGEHDDEDEDAEDVTDDVDEAEDDDEDARPILHAGDLDGVDVDELDEPDDDEPEDDEPDEADAEEDAGEEE